jgi:hypothetical protein
MDKSIMTKRKLQPPPKEVTIKQDAELIVTFIGVDDYSPLARGKAKLSRVGRARCITVLTTDGEIRIVVL